MSTVLISQVVIALSSIFIDKKLFQLRGGKEVKLVDLA